MNWYRLSVDEVFAQLRSSEGGLAGDEAKKRIAEFGSNELEERKKKSAIRILLSQFRDLMILILLAAAVLSGIIGDITDSIVILVIVILNAVIGFVQEFRAEKAMESIQKMSVVQCRVLRDGKIAEFPATDLVPGDVVHLEAGSAVPADLRLFQCNNLRVDEATLTGESVPVEKTEAVIGGENLPLGDQKNLAFKGTFVSGGRGTGVVVATGMKTELGRIAGMLQEAESLTPLQQRMASFGKKLSILVLFLCLVFFGAGWLRGEDPARLVLTSISLAVAAIPEALPAVITISLALAAKRMIRLNSLVRKLPAVETLGSVTFICTDKTGTLTRNKMHVEEVFFDGHIVPRSELSLRKGENRLDLLMQALALNNDATEEGQGFRGDSTEIAFLEAAKEYGVEQRNWPRVAELPFDADRKLMTTFHSGENGYIAFTKGAPDLLIERTGVEDKDALLSTVDEMASRGLRVLGFAFRKWESLPQTVTTEHEKDLEFLGLAGIIDPPREEVPEAVQQCRTAGIIPVMITGDHPLTAKNIAERIGILAEPGDKILTGQELATIGKEKFREQVEQVKVYARVSPEQKFDIVTALQEKGHFVAMTGDGVNDAPSLRKANIGIAMGITGTDVAKEASHMILLDDNFSTIVRAVREGRRIYDNILKFIKFLMTTNSSEILTLLVGPLLGLPVALLPIHILWINLVSDGLPAISLSFEKAESDIMKRPPRPPQQTVFAGGRGMHMIWVGVLMAALGLSIQAWAMSNGLPWQTMLFNFLCLGQMAHVLAIRTERESVFRAGIFSNRLLIISVAVTIVLQLLVTYAAPLQSLLHTQALSPKEFIIVAVASALIFVAVEVEKWIRYRLRKSRAF